MCSKSIREGQLEQFFSKHFLQGLDSITQVDGDAGLRTYYRIYADGKSYIAMDCPPSYCHTQPFIDVANFLIEKGFSAPQIIYQDTDQGFLVLKDFGNLSVKNYLLKNEDHSDQIYKLIVDLLVSLQKQERMENLKSYDNDLLESELKLFYEWYIPYAYKRKLTDNELKEFAEIWQSTLNSQHPMDNSIVLRDYHAENMMYLADQDSINKLGLLDFQDALWGSPIYDLVSVLEDARLEIPRQDALEYIEYFAKEKNLELESVLLNYHILGAQRNSRILGVFARKAIRDNDISYLQYIPRVLKYLEYDLSHASLRPLKDWLEKLR